MDPLTWAITFYALVGDIPNGGITNFFSQLIKSFGYTVEESLLYGTPGGAVEVVTLLVGGYLGDKLHNRILVSSFGLVAGIVGMALIVGLPLENNGGRLGGYYLTQATAMPFVAFLSLISTNVVSHTRFELRDVPLKYLTRSRLGIPRKRLWPQCTLLDTVWVISLGHRFSGPRTLLDMYRLRLPSLCAGCVGRTPPWCICIVNVSNSVSACWIWALSTGTAAT